MLSVTYFHPVQNHDGKILSTANIIWAQRDCGDSYYSYSKFAMKAGKFPANHPCAPFDSPKKDSYTSQFGDSERLRAFRARGYWASCFPEGDGITLKWWQDVTEPTEKTAAEVMQDIRECFGWEVVLGPAGR
jgi:hypothetical protein